MIIKNFVLIIRATVLISTSENPGKPISVVVKLGVQVPEKRNQTSELVRDRTKG